MLSKFRTCHSNNTCIMFHIFMILVLGDDVNKSDQNQSSYGLHYTWLDMTYSAGGCLIIRLKWTWWHHQMETFSALLVICAGKSPVPGDFPAQRRVVRSFDVLFDLRLNKLLSKQSWGWWFETLPRPLLRLTHRGLDKMAAISQTTLSNLFHEWKY